MFFLLTIFLCLVNVKIEIYSENFFIIYKYRRITMIFFFIR